MGRKLVDRHGWIFATAVVAAVTTLGGWYIIDGLNVIADLLGKPKAPVNAETRAYSSIALFLAGVALEVVVWSRGKIDESVAETMQRVQASLDDGVHRAVEDAVLQSLLPTGPEVDRGSRFIGLSKTFVALVADVPASLLPGYSVILEAKLAELSVTLRDFERSGAQVNVFGHLEMTRRFSETASSFLQINRRAFHAPSEWTQEWCSFVAEMGRRDVMSEYIVLMSQADLIKHAPQIKSMDSYLRARRWTMGVCMVEDVMDALGGHLTTPSNVDVYDARVAKLQTPPNDGRYQGGIDLDLRLVELSRDQELASFVRTVTQFATPAKAFVRAHRT
jgi:hypothetical protein